MKTGKEMLKSAFGKMQPKKKSISTSPSLRISQKSKKHYKMHKKADNEFMANATEKMAYKKSKNDHDGDEMKCKTHKKMHCKMCK